MVLFVGIGMAASVAVFEFWYHYRTRNRESVNSEKQHKTVGSDMIEMALNAFDFADKSDKENVEEIHTEHQHFSQSHKQPWKHVTACCCTKPAAQRSLCGEMLDEFRYALRCMDSHRRPALKRRCPTCHLFKDIKEFIDVETRASTNVRCSPLGSASNDLKMHHTQGKSTTSSDY